MAEIRFERRSPWQGVLERRRYGLMEAGAGVQVQRHDHLSVCAVMLAGGARNALAKRLEAALGTPLPDAGTLIAAGNTVVAWDGPDRWRVWAPGRGEGQLAGALSDAIGDVAAVVEQTHGVACLTLSGPKARNVLGKGTSLDVHPKRFGAGACALTQLGHIGVHLSALDNSPRFAVQLSRSMAGSFAEWLIDSSGEFGLDVG